MIRSTEQESTPGLMAVSTQASGRMGNSTAKVFTDMLMATAGLEFGLKARGRCGLTEICKFIFIVINEKNN